MVKNSGIKKRNTISSVLPSYPNFCLLAGLLYLVLSNLVPKPMLLNQSSLTYMTEALQWAKKKEKKTPGRVTEHGFPYGCYRYQYLQVRSLLIVRSSLKSCTEEVPNHNVVILFYQSWCSFLFVSVSLFKFYVMAKKSKFLKINEEKDHNSKSYHIKYQSRSVQIFRF